MYVVEYGRFSGLFHPHSAFPSIIRMTVAFSCHENLFTYQLCKPEFTAAGLLRIFI